MYSNIRSGHFLVAESVKCTVGLNLFFFLMLLLPDKMSPVIMDQNIMNN